MGRKGKNFKHKKEYTKRTKQGTSETKVIYDPKAPYEYFNHKYPIESKHLKSKLANKNKLKFVKPGQVTTIKYSDNKENSIAFAKNLKSNIAIAIYDQTTQQAGLVHINEKNKIVTYFKKLVDKFAKSNDLKVYVMGNPDLLGNETKNIVDLFNKNNSPEGKFLLDGCRISAKHCKQLGINPKNGAIYDSLDYGLNEQNYSKNLVGECSEFL